MTKSTELLEILQSSVAVVPELDKPLTDNGPANIYDRVAALQIEAKELRAAGKPMSARKKLNEAAHFRKLVKRIEKRWKILGKTSDEGK